VLWDRLFRLKQQGVTLILTTHYMDEAEQLCDRLVVMDGGRIVAHGTPRDLIAAHATGRCSSCASPTRTRTWRKLRGSALAAPGDGRVEILRDRVVVYAEDGEAALAAVHALGLTPLTALVRRSTLEDVFLKLTGRSLVD